MQLVLPFPPKELSPNARVNRWEKARIVREYREACSWEGVLEKGHFENGVQYVVKRNPLTPPVEADVTFVVPTRHKRDIDNLLAMLKPAWDGLVDAGVLAGDDYERFRIGKVAIGRDGGPSRVIVELTSLVPEAL